MLAKRNFLRSFYRLPASLLLIAIVIQNRGNLHSQEASSNTATAPENQDGSFRRSWQVGPVFAGGFVPSYRVHSALLSRTVELNFLNGGLQAGKVLTRVNGPGILRGRGEAVVEILPFWLGNYPVQTQQFCVRSGADAGACLYTFWGPYKFYGASATPLLFRWNFMKNDRSSVIPWTQLGAGVLWTDHKFPLLGGSTSVINFTPQVGIGESLFVRKNRSLDFAIKAINITNAGLGANDPGINVTLQFSAGYSWWK